jgi:DNA polymerase-3 subunit gamma/tau
MSYVVFARKYRPQTFEDIVAQEHVTRTLKNSIKNDRVGQGYLFCGPRGTGKTTIARILAKAINCVNGPIELPCNECSTCKEITSGNSLDVLEIDAASNTGVDDIRTLRENVRYLPTSGKRRIYIIDEVHRLSPSAFDALLKTLEEPPEHVMFIFATTEPLKVPETILSRTQRFDFKLISIKDLTAHLKKIAYSEKLKISDSALRLIARKGNGSVRDSLSLLDQIAAYATESITDEIVIEALGLVDKKLLLDFTKAVAAKDKTTVLNLIKNVIDGGVDSKDFIGELLEHYRNLLILATDKNSTQLLNISEEELEEFNNQSDYFSVGDLLRIMKIATDIHNDLKYSGLDDQLLLEIGSIKMAEMEATVKFEDILEILNQNQISGVSGSSDLFSDTEKKNDDTSSDRLTLIRHKPEKTPDISTTTSLYSKTINLPIVENGWKQFLAAFHQKRPMLASQLGMVEIKEVKDNLIVFAYPTSGENSKLIVEKAENSNIITSSLREFYKANINIKFIIDENHKSPIPADNNENSSQEEMNNLVESSPHIKKLMDKVDGRIIGIRKVK